MKFKYKLLLATFGLTILLIATETAMQFFSDYRFVGFEKKQGSWYGIASQAQADNSNCQVDLEKTNEQLDQFKQLRSELNADIEN